LFTNRSILIKSFRSYFRRYSAYAVGLLVALSNGHVMAQVNLVPNPSFEEYFSCPDDLNQVDSVVSWKNFGNTPDYFNSCATGFASVPYSSVGYQYPVSGFAYCGLLTYEAPGYREYIGSELTSTLIPGTTYYASMRINFANIPGADPDLEWWNCMTNKLGIRFGTTEYSEGSPHPTDNICHVYDDEIISDTLGWYRVFGSFTPATPYQYIVIGNFFDDANTDTIMTNPSPSGAYYFIDDVAVSTDSDFVQNYVGSILPSELERLEIYPNPTLTTCDVVYPHPINNDGIVCNLYNALGESIMTFRLFENQYCLNLSALPSGPYFLVLHDGHQFIRKKIIKH